jgi:aspartokinase
MTNITREVWDILSNDISIRKDLNRELINVRALAKYIIQKYHLRTSIDGAISAIRRFEKDTNQADNFKTVLEVLQGAKINTKTNMVCVTLGTGADSLALLADLLKEPPFREDQVRITKGEEILKILLSQESYEQLKKKHDGKLSKVETELAEIAIILSAQAGATKGVFARITNEVANYDINIKEVITIVPELLIFVQKKDLIRAHDAVFSLVHMGKSE